MNDLPPASMPAPQPGEPAPFAPAPAPQVPPAAQPTPTPAAPPPAAPAYSTPQPPPASTPPPASYAQPVYAPPLSSATQPPPSTPGWMGRPPAAPPPPAGPGIPVYPPFGPGAAPADYKTAGIFLLIGSLTTLILNLIVVLILIWMCIGVCWIPLLGLAIWGLVSGIRAANGTPVKSIRVANALALVAALLSVDLIGIVMQILALVWLSKPEVGRFLDEHA